MVSSSGRYTDINGATYRRIPFDAYKIGRIASGKESLLITNDVANDPSLGEHDWAIELGLVSFAGFQLCLGEEEPLGVLALFSKHTITPEERTQLEALSGIAAQMIHSKRAEEELKNSGEYLNQIINSMGDAV